MKKPSPPSSPSSPFSNGFTQVPTQEYQSPSQANDFDVPPVAPPENFYSLMAEADEDIYIDDHLIEARDASVGVHSPDGFVKQCTSCQNYWCLDTLAPVKNLKPDGTPYLRREEYCIFTDKLFTLSERSVFSCTRFTPKQK